MVSDLYPFCIAIVGKGSLDGIQHSSVKLEVREGIYLKEISLLSGRDTVGEDVPQILWSR